MTAEGDPVVCVTMRFDVLDHDLRDAIGTEGRAGTPPHRKHRRLRADVLLAHLDVYSNLPGKIKISHMRKLQQVARGPSGRALAHRFMVRGHWRRPGPNWKDQSLCWIEAYWRGPSLAGIIEREYHVSPSGSRRCDRLSTCRYVALDVPKLFMKLREDSNDRAPCVRPPIQRTRFRAIMHALAFLYSLDYPIPRA
ncbi:MAG: hypothetical protein HUU20_01085 [Pirellulales bacterium]|nr:hypothetical protein [Pirellulales bacterium]